MKVKAHRTILTEDMIRSLRIEDEKRQRQLRKERELLDQIIAEEGQLPYCIAIHGPGELRPFENIKTEVKEILAQVQDIKELITWRNS